MSRILILTGSPSRVSRTAALAAYVAEDLKLDGHDVEILDLRKLPPAALLAADTSDPAILTATQAVLDADALVIATPIYKASYSGLLKVFLDLLPQQVLRGKVVLPLATGGTVAHLLAIDYSLRPVLSAMGAAHVTAGRFVLDQHIEELGGSVMVDDAARDSVTRAVAAFRLAVSELRSAVPA